MVQHIWKRLDVFPLVFSMLFAIGVFVPCIISLSNGHVTPYVPYISEGGGKYPEAGIFSFCMSASAFICLSMIMLRFLLIEELNTVIGNYKVVFLNKIALVLGGLSSLTLILVASYPASTVSQVHNSAAGVVSVGLMVYLTCHTMITYKTLGKSKMFYFRLIITILSGISLILIATAGLIASSMWIADHGSERKTPEDQGFAFYVTSASSEWIMVSLLVLFFGTYICEFRKAAFYFHIEAIQGARKKPQLSNLDIRQC